MSAEGHQQPASGGKSINNIALGVSGEVFISDS